METRCLSSVVLFCFYIGVRGYCRHPMGGVLFVWETPERFRTFENVAYIEKVVSSKWGKFNFASHTPLIIFVFILQIENHISDIDNWGGKCHDIYALKGKLLFLDKSVTVQYITRDFIWWPFQIVSDTVDLKATFPFLSRVINTALNTSSLALSSSIRTDSFSAVITDSSLDGGREETASCQTF